MSVPSQTVSLELPITGGSPKDRPHDGGVCSALLSVQPRCFPVNRLVLPCRQHRSAPAVMNDSEENSHRIAELNCHFVDKCPAEVKSSRTLCGSMCAEDGRLPLTWIQMDVNNVWSFAAPHGPVKVLPYQLHALPLIRHTHTHTQRTLAAYCPCAAFCCHPLCWLTKLLFIHSVGLWFHKCSP